jgi:hypothetical protein
VDVEQPAGETAAPLDPSDGKGENLGFPTDNPRENKADELVSTLRAMRHDTTVKQEPLKLLLRPSVPETFSV